MYARNQFFFSVIRVLIAVKSNHRVIRYDGNARTSPVM